MTQKTLFFKLSLLVLTTLVFTLTLHGISHAQTYTHIHIDAVNGTNAPGNGAAAKPYKSITYALLLSTRSNLPDPWHVHIHPGTYDADPAKPASEREIFPLVLRNEMIFEGTTTAEECVIDGKHTGATSEPILAGTDTERVIIRNLTIQNSLRTNGPGGILLSDSTGTKETPSRVEGCIVHNNRGGGMWSNMPLILTDNTFSNHHFDLARVGGYGVATARSVSATNNTFSGNDDKGLHIAGDSAGDISENTFENNGVGGFYISGTLKANVAHNTFNNNSTGGHGGAGFYAGALTGDVTHNTFTNNHSDSTGGGFRIFGTLTGNVTHNMFTNNSSSSHGGGFNVDGTLMGNLTHNTFENNNSGSGGGGGGFHVETLIGNVTRNTFTNNNGPWIGGGFYIGRTFTGDLTHNIFNNNNSSSNHGGGFWALTFTGDVTHNTFENNSSDKNGGGFDVGTFTGDIAHNTFNNNNSGLGGGFHVVTLVGTVHHNLFDSNQSRYGGGFQLDKSTNTVEVFNNIFFNNVAGETGGSVRTLHATHFTNNLFMISDKLSEGVVSQGAAVWLNSPECRFHNNIFSGVQTAIFTESALDLPITHNLFHNIKVDFVGSGGNNLGVDLAFWELVAVNATDNLEGAPLLVDPVTSRDFHLQAGSPAIDAGTNEYAPSDDLDGVARPVGETVDIGPYEYGGISRTPHALKMISGDNQQGTINTALANPFIVEVTNQSGSTLSDVTVTFAVTEGGGSLSTETATTDADGRAESTLTLGPDDGTNTVSVSVSGIQGTVTFTAVATPPETRLMVITGTITNMDGTPTATGLPVTATIGSTTQTAVSESGGNYNVTFVKTSGIVARSSDTVEVQVVNQATGESARISVQLSSEQILAQTATIDLQLSIAKPVLDVPAGISLIHVPLKVTMVDGEAMPLNSVGDLYDALGGVDTINILITRDPTTERWISYLGDRDRGKTADKALTDDLGIIASMKAPVSISLGGDALGTDGSSAITLHPGLNLVGVPLKDSRIARVSDLFFIEGVEGNVQVIIVSDNGQFKLVARPGDDGDIPITGGQSFILTARAGGSYRCYHRHSVVYRTRDSGCATNCFDWSPSGWYDSRFGGERFNRDIRPRRR